MRTWGQTPPLKVSHGGMGTCGHTPPPKASHGDIPPCSPRGVAPIGWGLTATDLYGLVWMGIDSPQHSPQTVPKLGKCPGRLNPQAVGGYTGMGDGGWGLLVGSGRQWGLTATDMYGAGDGE